MLQGEQEITLLFLADLTDIDFEGKGGGAVMKWIDQTGYASAVGWRGQYCFTVYVGVIRFYRPVLIDNVVEVSAKLIYTDRSSGHVTVEVNAGDPKEARLTKTRRSVIGFVAGRSGSARGDRTLVTGHRGRRCPGAVPKRLMELRKGIEEETRIHAGLRAERDRSVPVMDVKAVDGRSVGGCP
jgi:acyl-CoA hydrolase